MIWDMHVRDLVLVLILIIFFILVVFLVIHLILRRKNRKTRLKMAELENESIKMNMMFKKILREELDDARLFLKDHELKHIDSLHLDNSILSRKILYKMKEMEEKTKRLDLGVNKARLENKIEEIGEHERKVF